MKLFSRVFFHSHIDLIVSYSISVFIYAYQLTLLFHQSVKRDRNFLIECYTSLKPSGRQKFMYYSRISGLVRRNKQTQSVTEEYCLYHFIGIVILTPTTIQSIVEFSCASKSGRVSTKNIFLAQKIFHENKQPKRKKGIKKSCDHRFRSC